MYWTNKYQTFIRHSMILSVKKMTHPIVQRLSQTNDKTSCLNAGHYFAAQTGNFLSQEEVVVLTEFKHHETMRKQRYQHLKALFIHFMHLCGTCLVHKK